MKIEVDVRDEASPFVLWALRKQLPFATKEALNDTAEDFQKAERARLGKIFTLRRKLWAERSIKISPFATKQRQEVRIAIDPPEACAGLACSQCARLTTPITARPRCLAPSAISMMTSRMPLVEMMIMTSRGPKAKLRRICSA